MTKPNVAAIFLAAQLLIVATACKDESKKATSIAAVQPTTQVAEENDKGTFIPLTPSPNASPGQRLIIAAYNGDIPTVQKLVAEGVDVNARYEIPGDGVVFSMPSTPGARPTVGQPAAVAAVGIRIDLVDHLGNTALHEALMQGRLELAAYLLDHGADINAKGPDGIPALQNALFDPKTLDFLIARGADVNIRNNDGDSPLYHAVSFNDINTVKKLLKAGADVNSLDHRGDVPLHVVGDASMARLLLAAGARVDLKDEDGFTPLMNVEWSVKRVELDRAARAKEIATTFRLLGGGLMTGGRGSDLEELEKVGTKGEMLAHRLNDLRSTEEKGTAGVLKAAARGKIK